jgi:hypothetical protein
MRIDDVGIVGFEPPPVTWRNPPIEAGRDQTEAAAPTSRPAPERRNHAYPTLDEIGRHLREPIEPAGGKTTINGDVLALDIPAFAKTPTKHI